MSKTTKRKYVLQEIHDLTLPEDSQCIVKILKSSGNYLYEVINSTGDQYLVSLPTKFRKTVWVKRDDYVLFEPIKEGNKVKGEIVKILTKDHIKQYRAENCWPYEFDTIPERNNHSTKADMDEELFVNTNRVPPGMDDNSDSSSNESDSD